MDAWQEAVEAAYKLGIRECQEGVDYCFNTYLVDINNERKEAWSKGYLEEHNKEMQS